MSAETSIETDKHVGALRWGAIPKYNPAAVNRCPRAGLTTVPIDAPLGPTRYARMFSELPSFQADEQFLRALGRSGGLCDCGDVDDFPDSLGDTAAGWPIFGQFVAHDITADRSALRSHANVKELRNARSPQLNLECFCTGTGHSAIRFFTSATIQQSFCRERTEQTFSEIQKGIALIADPRNDSHLLISQMHLAMLKAHNRFVDEARLGGIANDRVFDETARQLRWHYQWFVLNEFLPAVVGHSLADRVLAGGPHWFGPGIPLEFAGAAYRYGHSQIRHRYRLNSQADALPLFPNLLGFRPVPREYKVDWTLFFDTLGKTSSQRCKKIDGKVVRALIQLPVAITGECKMKDYHSLAVRDLQRGQSVGLPSGEAVARHIGVTPLTTEQIGIACTGWQGETPLWYYILREADVCAGGHRLGPVGGRIVAEVLIGFIDSDATSFRRNTQDWRPHKTLSELLAS